jgi:predicted N-formylglutamate amidohydrolase
MEVLVTVPHGFCPTRMSRECDTRAGESGSKLAEALREALPESVPVKLFFANTERKIGDLNRRATRYTNWRINIQNTVEKALAEGKSVLLFDVHSFPAECTSFCKPPHYKIPQIVLLDENDYPHAELMKRVKKSASLDYANLLRASHRNDITVQARKAGAEAMLWEFNESKNVLSEQKFRAVAHELAQYALDKFKAIK